MEGGVTQICIRLAAADPGALASVCAVLSGLGPGLPPAALDGLRVALAVPGRAFDLRDGVARGRAALAELRAMGVVGCRAGVGPQRVLAVLAADLAEAEGVLALTRADVPGTLWPLPVERLWCVGGAVAAALRREGITTVGELVAAGPGWLRARFGGRAHELWSAALGRDFAPATEGRRRGA
jgi:hypothetical protein